ncbi:hypothetical protein HDU86_008232 [Geranomyces michiganensis]|nr:hypothetical protein HDU86_008232 [Geranomyces michiganensis]
MRFPNSPFYANDPAAFDEYIFLAAPPDSDQEARFLSWLPDLYTRATVLAADFAEQCSSVPSPSNTAQEADLESLPDIKEAAGIITAADEEELSDIGGAGGSSPCERVGEGEVQVPADASGHLPSLTFDGSEHNDVLEPPASKKPQSSIEAMIDAMRENAIAKMMRDAEAVCQESMRDIEEGSATSIKNALENSSAELSEQEDDDTMKQQLPHTLTSDRSDDANSSCASPLEENPGTSVPKEPEIKDPGAALCSLAQSESTEHDCEEPVSQRIETSAQPKNEPDAAPVTCSRTPDELSSFPGEFSVGQTQKPEAILDQPHTSPRHQPASPDSTPSSLDNNQNISISSIPTETAPNVPLGSIPCEQPAHSSGNIAEKAAVTPASDLDVNPLTEKSHVPLHSNIKRATDAPATVITIAPCVSRNFNVIGFSKSAGGVVIDTPTEPSEEITSPTCASQSASAPMTGSPPIPSALHRVRTPDKREWFGESSLDDETSTDSALLAPIEDQSFDLLADDPNFSPRGHPVVPRPSPDAKPGHLGSVVPLDDDNEMLLERRVDGYRDAAGKAKLETTNGSQQVLPQVPSQLADRTKCEILPKTDHENQICGERNGDIANVNSFRGAQSPAKGTRLTENIAPTRSQLGASPLAVPSPRRSLLPTPTASSTIPGSRLRFLRPRKEREKKPEATLRDIPGKKSSLLTLPNAAHTKTENTLPTIIADKNAPSLTTPTDFLSMPEEAIDALVERNHAQNMVRRCVLKEIAVRELPAVSPTTRLKQRMEDRRKNKGPRIFTGGEGPLEEGGSSSTDQRDFSVDSHIPSRLKWDEHLISVVEFDPLQKTAMLSHVVQEQQQQIGSDEDTTISGPSLHNHADDQGTINRDVRRMDTGPLRLPLKSTLRKTPVEYERVSSPDLRRVEVPVWKLPPDSDEDGEGDEDVISMEEAVAILSNVSPRRTASRGSVRGRGSSSRGGIGRGSARVSDRRSPSKASASSA